MLPHLLVGVDARLLLPFLERRLSVVVSAAWSTPDADGEGQDPRVGQEVGGWT
jgi:hypothetical protein